MKKIINGKKYDTETAKFIGSYSNIPDCSDFSHFRESLYRKKTGEFFLHGVGGPNSRYAEARGQNNWSGGELIIPLSYDAAQAWAEKHMDADGYEDVFGEVPEDDTRTVVNLSISVTAAETARQDASKAGISLSAYVESLILGA